MDNAIETFKKNEEALAKLIDETTVAYVQAIESLKVQVGEVGPSDSFKRALVLWRSLCTSHPWKKIKSDRRFEQALKGLMQALLDDVVQRNDSLWAAMIPLMEFDHLYMIKTHSFDAALGSWSNPINPNCADKIKGFLENFDKHPHMQDARNLNVNRKLREMVDFVPEATDTIRDRILSFLPEDFFEEFTDDEE